MKNIKSAQFHICDKRNVTQVTVLKTKKNSFQVIKNKVLELSESIVIFHPMSFPQRG